MVSAETGFFGRVTNPLIYVYQAERGVFSCVYSLLLQVARGIMRIIVFGVFILSCANAQAQEFSIQDELERFQLYTACAPVRILVESLPSAAADIDLTRENITTTVRSRLRGARIYISEQQTPYLYVNINVVGAPLAILLN